MQHNYPVECQLSEFSVRILYVVTMRAAAAEYTAKNDAAIKVGAKD